MGPLVLLIALSLGAASAQSDAAFAKRLRDGRAGVLIDAKKAQEKPPAPRKAKLRLKPDCILRSVVSRMGRTWREDLTPPRVRLESEAALTDFQDAVATQWGFRPDRFGNVYAVASNQIFLIDDDAYYFKVRRFLDDSLAHEYAHFVQVHYAGARLDENGDNLESEAVAVQTWFRETYLEPGMDPGPGCRLP
ncbi:MAG: hypothetical protein HY077_04275 [Elusimicrobia bacterium]|nr:hypothetical protein [Elusimicrobiota bacterium]